MQAHTPHHAAAFSLEGADKGEKNDHFAVKNMFLRGFGDVEFTWRTFFGLIWVESTRIF